MSALLFGMKGAAPRTWTWARRLRVNSCVFHFPCLAVSWALRLVDKEMFGMWSRLSRYVDEPCPAEQIGFDGTFVVRIHGQSTFSFQFNLSVCFAFFAKPIQTGPQQSMQRVRKITCISAQPGLHAVFGFDSVLAFRFFGISKDSKLKGIKANQNNFWSLSHAMPMHFRFQNFIVW